MRRVKGRSAGKLPTDFDALVRRYPPRAIRDQVDYVNAQEVIDALTNLPAPSRGQSEYLETLSILFEAYEREHVVDGFDLSAVTPLIALQHLVEEHGMSGSDLGRLLGERSLGSKILTGERELSKAHARKLGEHFKVSPALFI